MPIFYVIENFFKWRASIQIKITILKITNPKRYFTMMEIEYTIIR